MPASVSTLRLEKAGAEPVSIARFGVHGLYMTHSFFRDFVAHGKASKIMNWRWQSLSPSW
ncbi:MAG: hypothetical protein DME76_16835 [Verrucomicrobia bacterium]|nr:MAG: hypothetical protein DME76_16835 [Verrucomicrobiota bacterium]